MRTLYASALFVMTVPMALAGGACTLIELPEATDAISSGGGGDGEGADECATLDDCLPTGTDCIVVDCLEGQCHYGPADEFVPISNQAVGDCVQVVCNGDGGEKKVDVEDPFDDGNECTVDSCKDGVVHNDSLAGVGCSTGVCNDSGSCVECLDASDCVTQTNLTDADCQAGICVPASCTDGASNGDETATDCGGSCAPCDDGLACLVGADCVSKVCDSDSLCAAPTCQDGVMNGKESDADCGGGDCSGCDPGDDCGSPTDCASFVCIGGICKGPSCSDGVRNGSESDVDCGGSDCGPCATGKDCKLASDCASKVCTGSVCQAPSCSDGIKNGSESGVDCGGPCSACDPKVQDPVQQPSL